MSEGPIKRERDAWKPQQVSNPAGANLIHLVPVETFKPYCGRKLRTADGITRDPRDATCTDCGAAHRADQEAGR